MDQATTYALLSAAAYEDARVETENRAPVPPGWRMLTEPEFAPSGSGANAGWLGSGFTARVFQGPAGQIVIAYAGTEFRLTEAGGITDFTSGNVPLAAALSTRASALRRQRRHLVHRALVGRWSGESDGRLV
jgi:hypothetical protein